MDFHGFQGRVARPSVVFACPREAPAAVVLASRVARALVLFAFSSVARAVAPLHVADAI